MQTRISTVLLLFLLLLPVTFAWSGRTHAEMCNKISRELGLPLADGCRYPDIKGDFQNHICYSDWCPAKRKAQIHLEAGRNMLLEEKSSEAAFQFGIACHYIADSLQPYHTKPSSSEKHREFEGIETAFAGLKETDQTFDELNEEARSVLDGIDANAASLANEFANKAMSLCFTMIKREMQNMTRAEVPDCSSVEKILRNNDCHLRDIRLSGKIKSQLKRVSQKGNEYTVFYLDDGRSQIKAFMFGSLALQDGALAEVEGTYYKERKTGNYWFYEEIDATSVKEENVIFLIGIAILLIFVAIVALVVIERFLKNKRRKRR